MVCSLTHQSRGYGKARRTGRGKQRGNHQYGSGQQDKIIAYRRNDARQAKAQDELASGKPAKRQTNAAACDAALARALTAQAYRSVHPSLKLRVTSQPVSGNVEEACAVNACSQERGGRISSTALVPQNGTATGGRKQQCKPVNSGRWNSSRLHRCKARGPDSYTDETPAKP